MAPDTWSMPEVVRSLARIEKGMTELSARFDAQHAEYVPREVWDQAWTALQEWKLERGVDIANLEAEQSRIRKDFRDEMKAVRDERITATRWAIGLGVTALSVAIAATGLVVNALGLGA